MARSISISGFPAPSPFTKAKDPVTTKIARFSSLIARSSRLQYLYVYDNRILCFCTFKLRTHFHTHHMNWSQQRNRQETEK